MPGIDKTEEPMWTDLARFPELTGHNSVEEFMSWLPKIQKRTGMKLLFDDKGNKACLRSFHDLVLAEKNRRKSDG